MTVSETRATTAVAGLLASKYNHWQRAFLCRHAGLLMATVRASSKSEMAILRRVVDPAQPYFSCEAARDILRLEFSKSDRRRMNQLAEKNRQGKLTAGEEEELDNFIRVGQTLGILRSKARRTLRAGREANGKKSRRE